VSTLGVLGLNPIPFGGSNVQVPSVGAVLNFLTTFGNVEVIATPSLMTVDNEKSSIKIGERRPMSQGTTQLAGLPAGAGALAGLGATSNSIKIETIENVLDIKPSVNDNDEILMEIEQDIQDIGEPIQIPGAGQLNTIKTKKTKTVIMTADQQTIVIGGLISRTKTHSEKKLPLLGDIPVLGYLFKSTVDYVKHSNLLLVLTPYVVRTPSDVLKVYERKRREHEEFGKLYFGDRITKFDPHVDYTKKPGPIAKLLHEFDHQMELAENGGPGLPDEKVIRAEPERKEETLQGTVSEIPGSDSTPAMPVMPMPIPMPVEPVVPEQVPAAPAQPAEGAPAQGTAAPTPAPGNNAAPATGNPATPNTNAPTSGEVPLNPNPPPAPPPN